MSVRDKWIEWIDLLSGTHETIKKMPGTATNDQFMQQNELKWLCREYAEPLLSRISLKLIVFSSLVIHLWFKDYSRVKQGQWNNRFVNCIVSHPWNKSSINRYKVTTGSKDISPSKTVSLFLAYYQFKVYIYSYKGVINQVQKSCQILFFKPTNTISTTSTICSSKYFLETNISTSRSSH